jgi:hypothetical protein
MLSLPSRFAAVILCFALLFLQRSWRHAEVLLIGAILGCATPRGSGDAGEVVTVQKASLGLLPNTPQKRTDTVGEFAGPEPLREKLSL